MTDLETLQELVRRCDANGTLTLFAHELEALRAVVLPAPSQGEDLWDPRVDSGGRPASDPHFGRAWP